ncbi:MAG: lipase family protein, partial [Mycobacterium sp.]
LAALVLAAATGCSDDSAGHLSTRSDKALPGDYGGKGPGSLISAQPLENLDPQLSMQTSLAARITYSTVLAVSDGSPEASGTVFVPRGEAPQGGWRIVALGHDDTGIHPECAPSASPSLLGLAPSVRALVSAGFVVAVPDYVGLGMQGSQPGSYHPFLDSTTAGYNMIDVVRATRKLVSNTSKDWIAAGNGQGGQAAWAANELAADYGGEMSLRGALALTPTAALEWLADAAANGTLNQGQQLMLQEYLSWLPTAYPDFPLNDYRRGAAAQHWDQLSACWGDGARARDGLARALGPHDVGPITPEATDRLHGFLRKTSLPQGPTGAPMLVTADKPGGLIPPEATAAAVDRACAMGDVIDFVTPPPDPDLIGWINDRFNGVPAPNTCNGQAASTTSTTTTSTTEAGSTATSTPDTSTATTTTAAATQAPSTTSTTAATATLTVPNQAPPLPGPPAEVPPAPTEPPA